MQHIAANSLTHSSLMPAHKPTAASRAKAAREARLTLASPSTALKHTEQGVAVHAELDDEEPSSPYRWSVLDPLRRLLGWPSAHEQRVTECSTRRSWLPHLREETRLLRDLTTFLVFPSEANRVAALAYLDDFLSQLESARWGRTKLLLMPLEDLRRLSIHEWSNAVTGGGEEDGDDDEDKERDNCWALWVVDHKDCGDEVIDTLRSAMPQLGVSPLPADWSQRSVDGALQLPEVFVWLADELQSPSRGEDTFTLLDMESSMSDSYHFAFAPTAVMQHITPLLAALTASWATRNPKQESQQPICVFDRCHYKQFV